MAAHFDNRDGYIWFNGELVDWPDVKLHVLSHALHYASSVFEGERVYNKKIFKLEEHTERLFYSAERMDMKIPYTQDQVNAACKAIVEQLVLVLVRLPFFLEDWLPFELQGHVARFCRGSPHL